MIYNLRICEGSILTYWKMVMKNKSCLFFFPPQKRFLVNWALCKATRQQWQAGLWALPVGIVGKCLREMTWIASDICGDPCYPPKHGRCGAPVTAARSRARAPRWAPDSLHEMKPFSTSAPCVQGGSMPAALHTPRKGGTWDANRHAAPRVCHVRSLPLLAPLYNNGVYAKVASNKGLKLTCVSL